MFKKERISSFFTFI